ncbi:MAG: hypothetical protein H7A37_08625 [Chlamydiales bacterium]|nr:hypothetical protein [Chlamydiia bacterium]MCP5508343.1 hypothetical protein [Chlamydiales bacterium]
MAIDAVRNGISNMVNRIPEEWRERISKVAKIALKVTLIALACIAGYIFLRTVPLFLVTFCFIGMMVNPEDVKGPLKRIHDVFEKHVVLSSKTHAALFSGACIIVSLITIPISTAIASAYFGATLGYYLSTGKLPWQSSETDTLISTDQLPNTGFSGDLKSIVC